MAVSRSNIEKSCELVKPTGKLQHRRVEASRVACGRGAKMAVRVRAGTNRSKPRRGRIQQARFDERQQSGPYR